MKLELRTKILAYLPYNLPIINNVNKQVELTCMDLSWHLEKGFKPILRPLSGFKNYSHIEIMSLLKIGGYIADQLLDLANGNLSLPFVSKGTYDVMCKEHIDFGNLIESGNAVDKNTVNK